MHIFITHLIFILFSNLVNLNQVKYIYVDKSISLLYANMQIKKKDIYILILHFENLNSNFRE